jgi:hypothetical protein
VYCLTQNTLQQLLLPDDISKARLDLLQLIRLMPR